MHHGPQLTEPRRSVLGGQFEEDTKLLAAPWGARCLPTIRSGTRSPYIWVESRATALLGGKFRPEHEFPNSVSLFLDQLSQFERATSQLGKSEVIRAASASQEPSQFRNELRRIDSH